MKKTTKFLSAILFSSFILLSCGGTPSFCDCNDNYGKLSESDKEKCNKMVDGLTEKEIIEKMQNCKNK